MEIPNSKGNALEGINEEILRVIWRNREEHVVAQVISSLVLC